MVNPGLLPFAILTQEENKLDLLKKIAKKIEEIIPKKEQPNVANSATILAGLVLKENQIFSLLRSDIMKESSVYQAILKEGKEEGKLEGIKEVAINLLKSGMSIEQVINVTGLTLEQVQNLPNN